VILASYTIALAGNPNVGKSTIFNALTGSRQHVGNWPGKTIEKKEGVAHLCGHAITVVDLPGTYSLNAYSSEEIIARDFIVNEHPELVVAVVDASNLERNLYLATQVLELEVPVVLALNMADTARKRGLQIDSQALSRRLGVPVVETVGSRCEGIEDLEQRIADGIINPKSDQGARIDYGEDLERAIRTLQASIEQDTALCRQYRPRWLAIKLLENDEDLRARLDAAGHHALLAQVQALDEALAVQFGDDAETLITDQRYRFIGDVIREAVVRPASILETRSDKADRIITHPIWGVLIFLLLMWIVFQFTANVSAPLVDWIDAVIGGPFTRWVIAVLNAAGLKGSWIESMIVQGVIAGVGGVLVFVPVLACLYLAIAMLEDTGYMARSAFVMDRVMRVIGLQGKSFLPLMVGFGCNVTAIYATRTLEDEDARKLTAFLTPFMSCGARLPIYVVFGAAFFGRHSGDLVFAMYLVGVALALATGVVLKHTAYRHKPPQPFILELPPYRVPDMKNVARQMGLRIGHFLHMATTVILASTILIWFLLALPVHAGSGKFDHVETQDSAFGSLSRTIAPALKPAGFGSWEAAGSLVTGFIAKEAVVGTMSLIYTDRATSSPPARATFRSDIDQIATSFGQALVLTGQEIVNIVPRTVNLIPGVHVPEADWLSREQTAEDTTALQRVLTAAFTRTAGSPGRGRLAAVAFNVFVLLYIPCVTSVSAMRHEFGPRLMVLQIAYTLALAWFAAVIVYQGGLLLGLG
jgi:ferrous iron transport protein B